MTVFNTKQRANKQFMFFGDEQNIARYDVLTHPIFHKLTDKQKGFFWQPQEIDLSKDSKDFKLLSEAQKYIFTKVISYQTMLDSVQGRSPALALLPHCSLPELEACIQWWCAMEQVHNESYSYLIRNVYNDPSEIFDNIISDENIVARAKNTVKYYDDFIHASNKFRYIYHGPHQNIEILSSKLKDVRELKKKLILCVASINALEGVSFYASFACSFAFAEQGLMVGNASIISLIARDEALHLAITQNILKKWREGSDDPEMEQLYQECIPEMKKIYDNVVEQEKLNNQQLFKNGSMLGLNAKILDDFTEYRAYKNLKNLKIPNDYLNKNPCTWMDKYLSSSDNQVAPMETEILSYVIGGIKNDIERHDFSRFAF